VKDKGTFGKEEEHEGQELVLILATSSMTFTRHTAVGMLDLISAANEQSVNKS
jgi:hypothetical protein